MFVENLLRLLIVFVLTLTLVAVPMVLVNPYGRDSLAAYLLVIGLPMVVASWVTWRYVK